VTTATRGVSTATGLSTSGKAGVVFAAAVMWRSTWIAVLIVRCVGTKAIEGLLPTFRHRSMVAVVRIKALVNVAVKSMMPVEPGAGPYEDATSEPVWTIVAIGCTVIRSVREVAVGAHRSHSNVDRHLRRCA